jgi:hypothetical protein
MVGVFVGASEALGVLVKESVGLDNGVLEGVGLFVVNIIAPNMLVFVNLGEVLSV